MALISPKRNQPYTVKQITDDLKLLDNPFLYFNFPTIGGVSEKHVLQSDDSDRLVEKIGDQVFRYRYTTDEWIPIFEHEGDINELIKHFDFSLDVDPYQTNIGDNEGYPYVNPRELYSVFVKLKGDDRKPYYGVAKNDEGYYFFENYGDHTVSINHKLNNAKARAEYTYKLKEAFDEFMKTIETT